MAQLDLLTAAAYTIPPSFEYHAEITLREKTLALKADGAYKNISEASEEVGVPQHVLRFWESRFPQVKPSRMRGARRYYRPEDIRMLKRIKTLLYNEGYTIKGAKKAVREGSAIPLPVTAEEEKSVDKQSLMGELRALKSMLASLL